MTAARSRRLPSRRSPPPWEEAPLPRLRGAAEGRRRRGIGPSTCRARRRPRGGLHVFSLPCWQSKPPHSRHWPACVRAKCRSAALAALGLQRCARRRPIRLAAMGFPLAVRAEDRSAALAAMSLPRAVRAEADPPHSRNGPSACRASRRPIRRTRGKGPSPCRARRLPTHRTRGNGPSACRARTDSPSRGPGQSSLTHRSRPHQSSFFILQWPLLAPDSSQGRACPMSAMPPSHWASALKSNR